MRAHRGGGPGDCTPEPPDTQSHTARNPAKSNQPASRSVPEPTEVDKCYSTCGLVRTPDGRCIFLYPHAVYTLDEAAALLRMSSKSLRKLHDDGAVPSLHHKAKPILFWGEDLIAFLRSVSATKGEVAP